MASSSWMYLTEDDQRDMLKVATLVCRRPDGGAVVAIHWRLYLAALKGRIAMRKHERQGGTGRRKGARRMPKKPQEEKETEASHRTDALRPGFLNTSL